jgi:hypothetical protein
VTSLGWRAIDSTGQCFQNHLPIDDGKVWEKLEVSLDDICASEHWGGANDGTWHPPLTGLSIGIGTNGLNPDKPVGTIWLEDLQATLATGATRPPARGKPKSALVEDFEAGVSDWQFINGQEFPGAAGLIDVTKTAHDGKAALTMDADFRAGGAYVGAHRTNIPEVPGDLLAVMMWVKSDGVTGMNLRLIGSDGQVFQGIGFPITPGGAWHEMTFHMKDLVHGEHWGGPDNKGDGVFHGPVTAMTITTGAKTVDPTAKKGDLIVDTVRFVAIPPR